jgi:hypothetical protein
MLIPGVVAVLLVAGFFVVKKLRGRTAQIPPSLISGAPASADEPVELDPETAELLISGGLVTQTGDLAPDPWAA